MKKKSKFKRYKTPIPYLVKIPTEKNIIWQPYLITHTGDLTSLPDLTCLPPYHPPGPGINLTSHSRYTSWRGKKCMDPNNKGEKS